MNLSLSVIGAIIVVIIALKFAKQIASKIIGFVVVVGLVVGVMYYKSWGPFEHNVAEMAHLQEKYCGENGDADICDCILTPIKEDMSQRFTQEELDSLSTQRIRAAYVLKKSMQQTKVQAATCLEKRGATSKYKKFVQDFIPIENQYLDMAENKVDELKGKLKDEMTSFKDNKKSIDEKY